MKRDIALSEVIGFLMIVALLGILFSMYLIYVLPIQGRDAEISHMKYITQEFIGLKADIDGLIINDKINLPIARSFELGTLSSVGTGALSIMPMSSYIEASGTLMVNEQNDFLEVIVNGDMNESGSRLTPLIPEIQCKDINECPPEPINFTISDRFFNITTKKREFLKNTSITINLTHITYSPTPTEPTPSPTPEWINATATINVTNPIVSHDLVLEMWDNRTYPDRTWIAERILIENLTINSDGTNFTYNILSDNDLIPNNSSDYYLTHASQYIPPDKFSKTVISTQVEHYPPRVGSLQYISANRYWVNQDLLYEMGGLFLNQPVDQGSSVMLVPSIAITPVHIVSDSDTPIPKVSINNIRITDTEDVSGSVSAQIFTKIDQINHNFFNGTKEYNNDFGSAPLIDSVQNFKLQDAEIPNAYSIWLQFFPDDPRSENTGLTPSDIARMKVSTELWKRGFDQIKTITNKTLSGMEMAGLTDYIYTFRIEDDEPQNIYSANLVIGSNAKNSLNKICPPITYEGGPCIAAVADYINKSSNNEEGKFILDYTESEVSLVMQSGAL